MIFALTLIALFKHALSASQISPNTLKLLNSFTRNCELVYIDENARYGLKATKDIHLGDTIMIVPPIYLLSTFDLYPWSSRLKTHASTFRLIIRLLYEKFVVQENSNRKLLIDSLPDNFFTAFSLTQEQKSRFEDYFGSTVLLGMPINCTSDYNLFIKTADKEIRKCKDCMNQNNFLWACQAVITRAYSHNKYDHYLLTQGGLSGAEQNEAGSAFIFGVDMFNHYPLAQMKSKANNYGLEYVRDPAHILVKADRSFLVGEEVFMTYGHKSNLELFINHGFIIENNPDDSGVIWIPSDGSGCDSFADLFQVCQFQINSRELNVGIFNFLFFKVTGTRVQVSNFYDVVGKRGEADFKTQDLVLVFNGYKSVIGSYSLNRCKGKIKTGKDLENLDMLDRLCQENHRLFMSHMLRLDHLLVSLLYKELIKL
jgi:hypothetical protein